MWLKSVIFVRTSSRIKDKGDLVYLCKVNVKDQASPSRKQNANGGLNTKRKKNLESGVHLGRGSQCMENAKSELTMLRRSEPKFETNQTNEDDDRATVSSFCCDKVRNQFENQLMHVLG